MKILIAEDEPRTARALQRLIHQRPGVFCIGMAMNGEEALAIMEKTPADLVITDIRMPVMDGIKLLQTLQERYPQCLTVVLSGYSQFDYAKAAMQAQAFDYLLKPINRDDLFALLDRAESAWKTRSLSHRRQLYSRAISGEVISPQEDRDVYCCLTHTGQPVWKEPEQEALLETCFGGSCFAYAGPFHTGRILLTDDSGQLETYFRRSAERLSIPVTMAVTRQTVRLSQLPEAMKQLQAAILQELRLFRSALLFVSPDIPAPTMQSLHPEQLAEAITRQDRAAATESLLTLLREGTPLLAIRDCLETVLRDTRTLHQLSAAAVSERRQAIWDTLILATEPAACAKALIQILLPEQEPTPKPSNLAETLVHHIHTNYHLPFSMEALSRQYGFTPGHLNKVFRQHTGMRPTEYLLKLRMDRARRLLESHPDMLIKDVAASVGYSDHQYFSKVFKKETGLWPSECQKQAKQG